MDSERSLVEWLRLIQIEWGLKVSQLSALVRISEDRLGKILETGLTPSEEAATVPVGFECVPPLIQIYKKLSVLYPDPAQQIAWLFTGNASFGNQKPIDVAASSVENLFWVSYFLATERS